MLASCVVITQASRLHLLEKAIGTFAWQTYPDRELVIVHDDGEAFSKTLSDKLAVQNIPNLIHCVPRGKTLGELRNISSEIARGQVVCQWDDDDFYHPQRLEVQIKPLLSGNATVSFLEGQFYLFYKTRELYIRDEKRPIPGTIAYIKEKMPHKYPHLKREEDQRLMENIIAKEKWASIPRFDLYVRTFHGNNTWGDDHHRAVAGRGWSVTELKLREPEIREALKVLKISGVKVRNWQEIAFNA